MSETPKVPYDVAALAAKIGLLLPNGNMFGETGHGEAFAVISGARYELADTYPHLTARGPIYKVDRKARKAFVAIVGLATVSPHKWEDEEILAACAVFDVAPTLRKSGAKRVKRQRKAAKPMDDHIRIPAGAIDEVIDANETPKAAATDALTAFPISEAVRLRDTALPALESGQLTGTFEQRPLMNWGRAFFAYQSEGLSYEAALGTGFCVAILWKTLPEERDFYFNLFQSIFGFDCTPTAKMFAKQSATLRKLVGIIHPQLPVILPLINAGLPIWGYGKAGSGKSVAVEQAAKILSLPYSRINGSTQSEIYDVLGRDVLKNEGGATVSEFHPGPVPASMRTGSLLNMDEITLFNPSVHAELHAVLEGKPLVIKANGGEVVTSIKGFCMAVLDNTLGLGESPEYVGTRPVNAAFRDRFCFIHFETMDRATTIAALDQELEKFHKTQGWTVK